MGRQHHLALQYLAGLEAAGTSASAGIFEGDIGRGLYARGANDLSKLPSAAIHSLQD
jgi:hypothetical protein